jgi:hypothetical protein
MPGGGGHQVRAAEPRKQKLDRRDAELILKLLGRKWLSHDWDAQPGTAGPAGCGVGS